MSEPPPSERLIEIVGEALRLPPPERENFVKAACPEAGEQTRVLKMLSSLKDAGRFMDKPTVGGVRGVVIAEGPGTAVGRYTLVEAIGEGGFGIVFRAEQTEPVKRTVALKIIKPGMDTREVIARFEAERQALALMDHPNIAKVFDAGATTSGRPYFVMELVAGEPIVAYCDRNALSTTQRLELFAQVCQAVQHAHTKGIIHRDIKPGNVLVADVDGRPTPKVIDFGIAKATSARLTEKTLFTQARQMIGTPAYMSPEQAQGGGAPGEDVDTRTDIYSLGVLLYELLTGVTPFDEQRLRSAAYDEIRRIIREDEPPKPSTRLSTLKDSLPSIAAQRHTEPGRLAAVIRGDLDWIVMCCLEKDRARRYETANALAADVLRHLAGEPVVAAPPSRLYRARKFLRRHRLGVSVGVIVVASLVVGLGSAIWQAGVAARERDAARTAAQAALAATRAADANRAEAEQIADFQSSQLQALDVALMGARLREDLLAEAASAAGRSGEESDRRRAEDLSRDLAGLNLSNVALQGLRRNIFQRAIEAIDRDFSGRPLVQARLLATTGRTVSFLGLFDEAIEIQKRALKIRKDAVGADDPQTLESYNDLGQAQTFNGNFTEAEENLKIAAEGRKRVLGEDASETLASLTGLAAIHRQRSRLAEAEAAYRDVLARLRRTNREEDNTTLERTIGDLATTLLRRGMLEESEQLSREVLALCRRLYGNEHLRTVTAVSNLATVLQARGDLKGATELTAENLAVSRRVMGDNHPSLVTQVNNLAVMLTQQGRFDEADPLTREALARLRERLGETHPSTLTVINNLGVLQMQRGRFEESAQILGDGVRTARGGGGGGAAAALLAMLLHHRADALRCAGRLDEARANAREAVDMYAAHADWTPAEAAHALQILSAILLARGDLDERVDMLAAAVERTRLAKPFMEASLGSALMMLGGALVERGRFDRAEPVLRECVEIRGRLMPEGNLGRWRYNLARSVLGGALIGRAREGDAAARLALLGEAEPMVVESYGALKDDVNLPPPTKMGTPDWRREALLRVVELYEAWGALDPGGHAARAAEWRAKLADPVPTGPAPAGPARDK